jgi:hypothetical protein
VGTGSSNVKVLVMIRRASDWGQDGRKRSGTRPTHWKELVPCVCVCPLRIRRTGPSLSSLGSAKSTVRIERDRMAPKFRTVGKQSSASLGSLLCASSWLPAFGPRARTSQHAHGKEATCYELPAPEDWDLFGGFPPS